MIERGGFTKGVIDGRRPDPSLYGDLGYYRGEKGDRGVQYPEDGSYLNPESAYQNKFKDTLAWIGRFVSEGKILDTGSGPAHLTYWAEKLGLPFQIVSCDVSQQILEWAKDKNGATSVLARGSELPFRDNLFNGILFADVLEHMWPEDARRAVCESRRVLVPGGYIFINIPNRTTWSDAARRDQGHVWLPTIGEMKKLLVQEGFDRRSIRHLTRGFPVSNGYRKITGRDLRLPVFGRSIFIVAKNP
jgi:ubiquinone/menaquinone biosynthesis C-methylase UbiE